MSSSLKYRQDLDGLRAIAILPVLLFHLGYNFVSGGYVGVDVFFVLSGYLISSIIIKEIKEDKFKFSNFFLRRIRRLLPMALTIYTFCLIVFLFIYPNIYFQKVLDALLSATFFSSNIYFWQQGGYFSSHLLELNPLLHTWSLSVEEQFYFFFPVFLLILFKISPNKKFHFTLITLCIITSLALAIIYAPSDISFAAFYLLPPRLYELGIGALLAFIIYHNPKHPFRDIKYLKELGLILILFSIFTFDERTTFPSYSALIPVLGAALVIFSQNKIGVANKILNQKHMVFIGLISYSLYLWHWPLIVMQNWVFTKHTYFYIPILTLLLSFILSIGTHRFIETPFRNKDSIPNKKLLLIIFSSFSILILVTLIFKYVGNDFIVDKNGEIKKTYNEATASEANRNKCTNKMKSSQKFEYCELDQSKHATKSIFVWGDSHGSALMPAFDEIADNYNVKFSNNTGCPPFQNTDRTSALYNCKRINSLVIEHLLSSKYDLIIVAGAFNNYLNWNLINTADADSSSALLLPSLAKNINNLHSTLEEKGSKFIFINQPPRFRVDIPINFLRKRSLGIDEKQQTISLDEYIEQSKDFKKIISEKWHSYIFYPVDLYCPNKICISEKDSELLYKDSHHVTNHYAQEIGTHLEMFISKIMSESEE